MFIMSSIWSDVKHSHMQFCYAGQCVKTIVQSVTISETILHLL